MLTKYIETYWKKEAWHWSPSGYLFRACLYTLMLLAMTLAYAMHRFRPTTGSDLWTALFVIALNIYGWLAWYFSTRKSKSA